MERIDRMLIAKGIGKLGPVFDDLIERAGQNALLVSQVYEMRGIVLEWFGDSHLNPMLAVVTAALMNQQTMNQNRYYTATENGNVATTELDDSELKVHVGALLGR